MGRFAGVDYGARRIGLAISDFGARLASPAAVLQSSGAMAGDAAQVLAWARSQEATGLVVGLPLNMDGTDSEQTGLSRAFADALRAAGGAVEPGPCASPAQGRDGSQSGPLTVDLWDERLSSFAADEHLRAAGVRAARRKQLRDALAATVILQSFLDARRPMPTPP